MGMRDISNRVLAELEQGHSRKEIYKHLSTSSPADAGKVAFCIASTPKSDLRLKYIKYNAALYILLVIYSGLTVLAELPIDFNEPTIFLLISTVLPLLFSYFVFRFHGAIYRLTYIWCLVDLLETLLLTGAPNGTIALKLLALFFIVVLAFIISRKVFPNLGIIGPKKDHMGNYLL